MTTHTDNTMINNINESDWLTTIANLVHQCLNKSNDRLHNPNDLYKALVYASLALSLIIPVICFALFVYPAMTEHAASKAQLASIPVLKQQLAQLKKMYETSHAALMELETDILLSALRDEAQAQYNPIDLHRLAHDHQLKIIAMDTSKDHEALPQFTEHFTATRFSWRLKGQFVDYLAFKKALRDFSPLIQTEREHLSTGENRQLDIIVDLNVYQAKEVAL